MIELVSLPLIGVLAIWIAYLTVRVSKLSNYQNVILGNLKDPDMAKTISGYMQKSQILESAITSLGQQLDRTDLKVSECFQKVGYIKYDAFGDVGGELSSSMALLTENGNGFVITSIIGRSESRVYVKPVESLKSTTPLSAEETKAISFAMKGSPRQ